ncbi:hypothetical protein DL95DRAFT_394984 [Leptodontidium sp. 2 PMI_412]|nr:hypothetical protein BKA61DRAFT_47882 [Leptodontidium sp. MPI-SDFR-AT-0119]KAH9208682.1 hypothetical protein DL95DRAFT_394984 [Leptodontidium sp. 2 PMI_412]
MLSFHLTLAILATTISIIPTSLAQNSSTPICLTNNLQEIIFSSENEKGKVCGLSFPVSQAHLDFSSCCAVKKPEMLYQEPCSQYCKVDKNQTVGFIDCAVRVAQAGNYSTGVVGCWENDATRSRMGVWGSVAVGLGAAVVGLVSFV